MDGTDPRGAAVRHAFLFRLVEDRRRGGERSLAEYQADFPGFETLLAEAHASVREEPGEREPDSRNDARVVGRFRILSELGRGGQGTVFLAHDPKLHRDVALKLLAPRFVLDPAALTRFRREAEAASRLDHPGICAVHEVGETEGMPYIVMPYIQGESLASRLRGTERPPSGVGEVFRILEFVELAARAAHAAHEAGIVHRDLKPGNVMVNRQSEPVLLDFGLALDEERSVSLTLSGDVFGTPAYMAPEQIDESLRADRRTDVYALGVLLFEGLTLRRPFEAPTRAGLYRAILTHDPPDPRRLNRTLSKDVKAILDTCLAKETEHRYATAADLADDLRRVRHREPIHARPAGPVLRFQRWVRRDPSLAGTVIGLVATLIVGFAFTNTLAVKAAGSLAEEHRLSDLSVFEYLEREAAEGLWPVLPQSLGTMNAWIAQAADVLGRSNLSADERSTLATTLADVRRRHTEADELVRRSIEDHREAWDETIAAIANEGANPRYAGLVIEPQVGLVPLGQDPDSRLFEFAHLQTGEMPQRDPSGRLVIGDETGLVFVLVPSGRFVIGENSNHRSRPEHEISLDAFFLSKYEMTQGQWVRTTGENPSLHYPGTPDYPEYRTALNHPVESVSWESCTDTLVRLGLDLPSEAQWEYAARAGTRTLYWTGEDRESLEGALNMADRSRERIGRENRNENDWPEFDDGYPYASPVGAFRPNLFGLHDVSGNVAEFVRDVFGSYENPVRAADGLREVDESGVRILRGGCYSDPLGYFHIWYRLRMNPDTRFSNQGLRPARRVWGNVSQGKR